MTDTARTDLFAGTTLGLLLISAVFGHLPGLLLAASVCWIAGTLLFGRRHSRGTLVTIGLSLTASVGAVVMMGLG